MAKDLSSLRALAEEHGQGHIFQWWDRLDEAGRSALLAQAAEVDFPLVTRLVAEHLGKAAASVGLGDLRPAEAIPVPRTEEETAAHRHAADTGEKAIRAGQVAALVVAGGRGTRLGYDGPKGTFPAGPITGKSLFQLHAEKLRAASRRYGAIIPWYIMTSEATDAATRAYLDQESYLGFRREDVCLFQQASIPAVGLDGKVLLADKGQIATSPNGHGGTLQALRDSGALDDMRRRGIRHISYLQVDNPLIKAVDPAFLGYHIERGSDFSSKALPKRDAEEGLGVFCYAGGKLRVVEYSDLPQHYKYAARIDGSLVFSAGNIAIHAISVAFLERLTAEGLSLPYHRANKKVSCLDPAGRRIEPEQPNAVQFEMFIFDALEHARNPVVLMVERWEEFAPIKRAEGEDSPDTARQAQVNQFARWLEEAGVAVPRDRQGNAFGRIEISPLYALDAEELRQRLPKDLRLTVELNLQP